MTRVGRKPDLNASVGRIAPAAGDGRVAPHAHCMDVRRAEERVGVRLQGDGRTANSLYPSAWHDRYVRPTFPILLLFNSLPVGVDADTRRVSPNDHCEKIVKPIRCDDVNRAVVAQC